MSMVQALGLALVLLALADVFMTVLYARSGTGLFTVEHDGAGNFAISAWGSTDLRDAAPFVLEGDSYMIFERDADLYEVSR